MRISDAQLDKLLTAPSCTEVAAALGARNLVPTPVQAAKLGARLKELASSTTQVRLGIVHTYTSELLDPWLDFAGALHELSLDVYHAPYGVTLQETSPDSGLAAFRPDITMLLLRREDLHPPFRRPLASVQPEERSAMAESLVASVNDLVARFRECVGGQIVATLLPEMDPPALGLYDAMADNSSRHWLSLLSTQVASSLRENFSGVTYLDLDALLQQVGAQHFFDRRLWYSSVFPYATEGALALSNAIARIAASLHQTRAKVIVLDADNTLWGGVIGEDGMHGIALGPEYPGSAYVDFQKRVLGLQQRGFILAMCSKNNEADVDEVMEQHPHQLLKAQNFAARRVNWQPKPDNMKALAQELNLGLDSFIFVDDSDYECNAIRHALPQVEVVQVPAKPVEIPGCLDHLARLEITSLTAEDLAKTAMYRQEAKRRSKLAAVTAASGSIDDYLRSLDMRMTIARDDLQQLARLAQMTQKTNQFNLTTRRYSEQDIASMIEADDRFVYHFSLADIFGDSGVVGLAIVSREEGGRAQLDTFLMSCRVIGRRAEEAFLDGVRRDLQARGITQLGARYLPTEKNTPIADFLPRNDFTEQADGSYICDLAEINTSKEDVPIAVQGP